MTPAQAVPLQSGHVPLVARLNSLANPFPYVVALTAVTILLAAFSLRAFPAMVGELNLRLDGAAGEGTKRLLFVGYFAFYLSWWAVYFASGWTRRLRTLRTLLQHTSRFWIEETQSSVSRDIDHLVRKAQTAIPVMAIHATTAVVALTGNILSLWTQDSLGPWEAILLRGAAVCGVASFVCFVVAADALDSLVNLFSDEATPLDLPGYFLAHARSRYYPGLALLIVELSLLAACFSPVLGALLLVTSLSVGSSYWFGSPSRSREMSLWSNVLTVGAFLPLVFQQAIAHGYLALSGIGYAWAAGILWAISSQILRAAQARLPQKPQGHEVLEGIMLGSVAGGIIALIPPVVMNDPSLLSVPTFFEVAAGVLSLPVGTGLYMAAARRHGQRPDAAAIYTRMKPLFAGVLAYGLMLETGSVQTVLALAAVGLGIVVLIGADPDRRSGDGPAIAIAAAVAWALGELCVALAGRQGLTAGMLAHIMVSGSIATFAAWLVWRSVLRRRGTVSATDAGMVNSRWRGYFLMHGMLSFGFAYPLLFISIQQVGIVASSLVSAFWPGIALVLGWEIARRRTDSYQPGNTALIAGALLLLGGVLASI